jgi:hypothetical protein
MLTSYLTFFKAHERLLIILLVLGFGTHLYSKYLDSESAKKDQQLAVLTQTLNESKSQASAAALQADSAAAAFQKALDTVQAQNSLLAASNARSQAALAQHQTADRTTLALPEVIQRWQSLVVLQPNDLSQTSSGTVISENGVRATVAQLEAVPTLTSQLADEVQIAANDQSLLTQQTTVTTALQSQVSALNVELADQSKQCTAQVAAEKIKTKRAFIRGFRIGAVVGFIGGLFTGHAL